MRAPSTSTLKAFQLAAQSGSFKLAASRLHLTPSAVSHRIKALEDLLGTALFRRGVRRLSLTEAGESYLRDIDHIFERLDAATRQLRARFGRNLLRLRVAPFFADEFLLPRLATLQTKHPDIDLQVDIDGTVDQTHPSDTDVSILLGSGSWGDLKAHQLFRQVYVPACAPALLARTPCDTIEQLNEHTLLVHEAHEDAWDRWAQCAGLTLRRPRRTIRFDTMTAMVRAAERSAGVGLVPAPLATERFRANSLTRLFQQELQTADSYFLVHRAEAAARPDIAAFRHWLLGELTTSQSAHGPSLCQRRPT
jgi:LysR family glycine cleavage system transcriptional activator